MFDKFRILITGGNRGLGYCLAEALCKKQDQNILIVVSAKNKIKGRQAVETLKQKYPKSIVVFYLLDLRDNHSIRTIVDWIHIKLGGIDIVVNNAGMHEGFGIDADEQVAREIFKVNLFGLINLTEQLIPILSQNGKIICLSSRLAIANSHDQSIEGVLNNPALTLEEIIAYANDFLDMIGSKSKNEFWNQSAFIASKSLMNAYVRHELSKKLIYNQMAFCVCPGWCKTDMGGLSAPLTPEQGIMTVLHLIFSIDDRDKHQYNGKFFADKALISF